MVTVGTIEQIKEKVAKKNINFRKKLEKKLINVSKVTNNFNSVQ
jgi:hypothetical protein